MFKESPINKSDDEHEGDHAEEAFWEVEFSSSYCLRDGDSFEQQPFDLEERTTKFGESVIRFAKRIPQSPVNNRLISQLVGAGTSIGANYCEANDGVSRKDFKNHIGTCRKEAKETKCFLRMVAVAEEGLKDEARELWKEARELHLIFCARFRKC